MSGSARHKVALVIGSGGLRCVSAFGALAVLQREGIEIDMVVACSGGAVAGTRSQPPSHQGWQRTSLRTVR